MAARVSWAPLTPAEIDGIWVRLKAGCAAKIAAREVGLPTSTVRSYLTRCGGIEPVPRRRGDGRLQLDEREEIARGLAAGWSVRAIASSLGRARGALRRELTRYPTTASDAVTHSFLTEDTSWQTAYWNPASPKSHERSTLINTCTPS